MSSFAKILRRHWGLTTLITAVPLAAGGWALAGTYGAPRLIRWQATQWVQDKLHTSIALGEIRVDPWHFTLDISSIALPASGAQPMVALGHLHLRFAPASLFESAWRLPELRLERPVVNAVIDRQGQLNLARLIPPASPDSGKPTALRIDLLAVSGGQVSFLDQSRAGQPHAVLAPLAFTLKDFRSNASQSGLFDLAASTQKGESFAWKGDFSTGPIRSRGSFSVNGLRADTIRGFIGPDLPVALQSGQVSLAGDYRFSHSPAETRLDLALPRLHVGDLGLGGGQMFRGTAHVASLDLAGSELHLARPDGAPMALAVAARRVAMGDGWLAGPGLDGARRLRLAGADLEGAKVDVAARQADLGTLQLAGLNVSLRREANGAIDLMRLLPPSSAAGTAPSGKAWTAHLGRLALSGGALHVEDRAVPGGARFEIAALSAEASGLGTDLTLPVALRMAARIGAGGGGASASLSGEGTVTPANGAGLLQVALRGLPLRAVLPYVELPMPVELRSGILGARGTLTLPAGKPAALRFAGEASLDNFTAYEKGVEDPLAGWKGLALSGLHYAPGGVEIARAHLLAPIGRVAVLADRTLNFTALSNPAAAPNPAPAGKPGEPSAPAPAPAPAPAAAPAPAPAPAPTPPAMPVRLHDLAIEGGSVAFADYSITPNFEARIEALRGHIRNITNAPDGIATIDLKGQVIDATAPVTVQGTANLFGYDRATDIKLAFRNIELPIFNPYSGVYAGYSIAKGKLSTDFSYRIVNRALQADHRVRIDQLQWGQATESKQRVGWPIRFATALLKDRHGVIKLDVPVQGTLDDPSFRLGPIIWHIVGNVLEKAVTAPFRLIGSLFAGAEKAQYVDFAPGSAQLPADAGASLAALAKGLVERPGVNLDIPAGPGNAADATAMADRKIDAALMAKEARKGGAGDVAALSPGDLHDRLKALYKLSFRKAPDFSQIATVPQAGEEKAPDSKGHKALESMWMREELRKHFAPTRAELAALGAARGKAIRDALLAQANAEQAKAETAKAEADAETAKAAPDQEEPGKGTIDPLRLFLATEAPQSDKNGTVRYELKLR